MIGPLALQHLEFFLEDEVNVLHLQVSTLGLKLGVDIKERDYPRIGRI